MLIYQIPGYHIWIPKFHLWSSVSDWRKSAQILATKMHRLWFLKRRKKYNFMWSYLRFKKWLSKIRRNSAILTLHMVSAFPAWLFTKNQNDLWFREINEPCFLDVWVSDARTNFAFEICSIHPCFIIMFAILIY